MLNITKYSRTAKQDKYITTNEQGKQVYFTLDIHHSDGFYWATWSRETRQGMWHEFAPYDKDSGRTTFREYPKRFSKSHLEKCDKMLEQNLDKYYKLWQAEQYQELANELHSDFMAIC